MYDPTNIDREERDVEMVPKGTAGPSTSRAEVGEDETRQKCGPKKRDNTGESSFFKRPSTRSRGQVQPTDGAVSSTDIVISSDEEATEASLSRAGSIMSLYSEVSESSPPEKRKVIPGSRKRSGSTASERYMSRRAISEKEKEDLREELKLKRELHLRGLDIEKLFKRGKINLERVKEEAEELTGEELIEMVTNQMTEVVRVAMSSSNLKGVFQKSLKMAAAKSLGCVHVMKERAGRSSSEDYLHEIRALKKENASLRKKMEDDVEDARRAALQIEGQAHAYLRELNELKRDMGLRKKKSPSPRKERSDAQSKQKKESPKKTARKTAETRLQEGVDQTTDSEMGGIKVILDPPEQWPEVRRPKIGGKGKILEEDPDAQKLIYKEYLVERERRDRYKEKDQIQKIGASSTPPSEISVGFLPKLIGEIVANELDKRLGKGKGRKEESKETEEKKEDGSGKTRTNKPRIISVIEPERKIEIRRVKEVGKTPTPSKEETWSRVLGRREKKRIMEESKAKEEERVQPSGSKRPELGIRRVPRTAAIQISCREGALYADVLREARQKINIEELGIPEIRPRRARTGALLLEIPGKDGSTKANELACKLREVLQHNDKVLITRPEKMADIRVRDLVSISKSELIQKLAEIGGCEPNNIKAGEITQSLNGLGSLLVRCPLTAAKAITKSARIKVGWTSVRVDLLPERPAQCYRCLETGHVRAQCRNDTDRGSLCYRCGEIGHMARGCTNPAKCIVCKDRGKKHDHRMGGPSCKLPSAKGTPARPGRSEEARHVTSTPISMEVDLTEPGPSTEPKMIPRHVREGSVTRSFSKFSIKSPEPMKLVEVASTGPTPMDTEVAQLDDTIPLEWSQEGKDWSQESKIKDKVQTEKVEANKDNVQQAPTD